MARSGDLLLAVLVIGVMLGAAIAIAAVLQFQTPASTPQPPGVVRVTLDSEQGVGGEPGQNTSSIWVARITSATSNETLASYQAVLIANGTTIIGPVTVVRGTLGIHGNVVFEFFETGTYCSPTPCPPPEGPDGLLGVNDYFRISNAAPATTYTVQVIWGATHAVAGQIVIHT